MSIDNTFAIGLFMRSPTIDSITSILEYGIDINYTDEFGYSFLHVSCSKKVIDVVRYLLENDANPNLHSITGVTPLHLARDSLIITELLIKHGADVNCVDNHNDTTLHCPLNSDVVEIVLKNGANVNAEDNEGRTPLMKICDRDCLSNDAITFATLFILYGADVNHKDKYEFTPLYWASRQGHSNIVKLLIYNGADINHTNKYQSSALYWACINNHIDIVEILLINGAETEKVYNSLFWSCIHENFHIMKMIQQWYKKEHPIQQSSKIVSKMLPRLFKSHIPEIVKLTCEFIHKSQLS